MTNLLWPGDDVPATSMSDAALLASMVAVESAWLDALVVAGLAPGECAALILLACERRRLRVSRSRI